MLGINFKLGLNVRILLSSCLYTTQSYKCELMLSLVLESFLYGGWDGYLHYNHILSDLIMADVLAPFSHFVRPCRHVSLFVETATVVWTFVCTFKQCDAKCAEYSMRLGEGLGMRLREGLSMRLGVWSYGEASFLLPIFLILISLKKY